MRTDSQCRRFIILLSGLVAIALLGAALQAEDFSVHIERLAEIDTTRPKPEHRLERVLNRSEGDRGSEMPEKTFDVLIRFKEFGDVRLAEGREAGPSTGNDWSKGMTFSSGLANMADVKTAWIKDSPNLLIVAWLDEPDSRGNGNIYRHGYVILQLQNRRAQVLLRGGDAINARIRGGIQEGALHYSHFSFNPQRRLLEERVTRYYERASDRLHDLGHPFKDEGGTDIFVARINETINLSYRLANGKLLPAACSLVYSAQKQDELSEVARFYRGAYATRNVLLKANAYLMAKHKDNSPGALFHLDEGMKIKVPVPEEWLIENFGHGLGRNQKQDQSEPRQ